MFFDVTHAEYVSNYKIRFEFEDGSRGVADLSDYPEEGTVFSAFFNLDYFSKFYVEHGAVVWGNGEVDIAPEKLYELVTKKPVRYPEVTPHSE
ncbi:MAG: DUF2442 domain-containing protein [Spirochaetaceae bacterium]